MVRPTLPCRAGAPSVNATGGEAHVAHSVDVPRYYLGVIDMLQKWNFKKRLERWTKIILKGRWAEGVRNGMSAVEPESYRRRFLAGMSHQLGLSSHEVGTSGV